MDNFEQKMQRASEELRQTTRDATPPPAKPVPVVRRGPKWLAFAAGFAVVALVFGVFPGLLGQRGSVGSNPSTLVMPDTTSSDGSSPTDPNSPTTTVQGPAQPCSSADVPVPGPVEGLPPEVAARRDAIIAAAVACDFDALEAVAGPNFSVLSGANGVDRFREWEEDGAGQLGTLLLLLGMTYAVIGYPDAPIETPADYVWPAAFAYYEWGDVPPNLLEELHAVYTQAELDAFFGTSGNYAGWRTAITDEGDWRYYTAGDQ